MNSWDRIRYINSRHSVYYYYYYYYCYYYHYHYTAWKVLKYGIFSGPYFPVFGLNGLLLKSPYSVRIQENPNQKKLRIWILFTQCCCYHYSKLMMYLDFFVISIFKKQKFLKEFPYWFLHTGFYFGNQDFLFNLVLIFWQLTML